MSLKTFVIVMLFLLSTYTFADFNAQVVRIIDGDTIDVLDSNGKKLRIRLLGIDTPEQKQQFGYESTLYLKKIINRMPITIISTPDKNKPYTLDYNKAENEARRGKIGLWFDENPLPPWKWRKLNGKK